MAWLVLNAGEEDEITIRIVEDNATKRVIKIGGEYTRAFDGTLRATVATEKAEWDLNTVPLDEADANAIEALFENGAEFELSGDIVGEGNTFDCMGTVVDSQFVIHDLSHRRQLRLLIQQV